MGDGGGGVNDDRGKTGGIDDDYHAFKDFLKRSFEPFSLLSTDVQCNGPTDCPTDVFTEVPN